MPGHDDTTRETTRGRPPAAPRTSVRSSGDAYGLVTVSVCTTCVTPGVTFDVMPATDLYVPAFLLEAS